jgi:hypothetical protein
MNRRDFMKIGMYAALTACLPKEAHAERVRQIQVYNPAGIDSIVEGMHFKVQTDRKEYILTLYNEMPAEPTLPDILDMYELKEREKELKTAFKDHITTRAAFQRGKQENLEAFVKTMAEAAQTIYENQHCGLIATAFPLTGAACYATHIIIDASFNGTYKMVFTSEVDINQSIAAKRKYEILRKDYESLVAGLKKRLHHASVCKRAGIELDLPKKERYLEQPDVNHQERRDRHDIDPGFTRPDTEPYQPPPRPRPEQPPKGGKQIEYHRKESTPKCTPRAENQPPVCKTETREFHYKGPEEGLKEALEDAQKEFNKSN